jgi:hypothetical protein
MREQQEIMRVRALITDLMRRAPTGIGSIQKTNEFKDFYVKATKILKLGRASLLDLNSLHAQALRIYA